MSALVQVAGIIDEAEDQMRCEAGDFGDRLFGTVHAGPVR